MNTILAPDLVIDGNTEMNDLINLLEKGKTELYSFSTLIEFFHDAGYGTTIIPILLQGMYNNENT